MVEEERREETGYEGMRLGRLAPVTFTKLRPQSGMKELRPLAVPDVGP
jgi:hypothetical protein